MNAAYEPVHIDIVSDVMCPWCYIGQKRLARAMASAPETAVEVHWKPFQLDPTLPPEGKDRKRYLSEKFGSSERAGAIYERVKEAGRLEGIAFDFDAIKVSPNTLDAHRLIHWAGTEGPEMQDKVVQLLFRKYFEQGVNIGDRDVLVSIAADCGMDPTIVRTLLESGADREAVEEEIAKAGQMGVQGVPCFVLENRYAVSGAQEPATLADAIAKVQQAKASGLLDQPVT